MRLIEKKKRKAINRKMMRERRKKKGNWQIIMIWSSDLVT